MVLNKKIFSIIFLLLTILSFFFGFFLRENSAGGGFTDSIWEWNNYLLLKKDFSLFLTKDYYAGRIPLYHFLNIKLNPFINNNKDFINFNFLYSLFVPIFFYIALKKNFIQLANYKIYLIVTIILLNPYFRTSSYWGLQENLAYIFLFLSFIFFSSDNFIIKKYFTIFFSFLAFYADQKFLILPIVFFFYFLNVKKLKFNYLIFLFLNNIRLISFCFILIIPAIFIFYLWNFKISGPSAQALSLRPQNFLSFMQIVSIPLFPLIILRKGIFNNVKIIIKKNFFYIILFVVFYFLIRYFFFSEEAPFGGGWAYKIFQILKIHNVLLSEFFYFLISLFSFLLFLFFFHFIELNLINMMIFFYFSALAIFIPTIFQEYFDPLFFLLIIFLIDKKFFINLSFLRLLIVNIYYCFFLISCIFYYQVWIKL
jgi:hypothetical protein